MAISIKGGPTLYGAEADQFFEQAQKNASLPYPKVPVEIMNKIHTFLKASADFNPDIIK
ncbi:MAG: hypothetical protein J1D77_05690 [Muribaculaceae bacterium]|nr:hypothetical protein [Muribaculaceae bacterium]